MRHDFTPKFAKSYYSLPGNIQSKFNKQLGYLLNNIRHPSLRAKKYIESSGVWQARVDDNVRFYFKIEGDIYILIDIKNHPK